MRPVRLGFAGLRSYRAPAEIDFTGLELFAIIGDTGAGKSTIIEALSLALYGRKTWSGGARLDDMIADGEKTLRVEFTFIADGHEWTVTRTWNRTSTPGINKLKRSDGAEVVDGSGPVTSRITELLGLDHSQFTQAVVIPQGRFDELLRATPAQRNKLLTSILGLDEVRKVGVVADALRNDLRPELAARQSRRELLPADPVAELTRATTGALDARTRADALQRAVADLGDSDARIAALDAAAIAVTDACDRVPADAGEVDALVRAATDADRLAERRVAAETRAAAAGTEVTELMARGTGLLGGFATRDAAVQARSELLAAATSLDDDLPALDAARHAVDQLGAAPPDAAAGIDPALTAAVDAAREQLDASVAAQTDAHERVTVGRQAWPLLQAALDAQVRCETELGRLHAHERDAHARVDAARAVAAEADAAAAAARAALDAATAADAAAAAAAGCHPGDDCPVCRRPLPDDFVVPPALGLDAAKQADQQAARDAQQARAALASAERDVQHLAEQVRAADADAAEATAGADRARAAAREAGCDPDVTDRAEAGSADDGRLALALLTAAHDDATRAVATATAAHDAARAAFAQADAEARAAVAHHHAQVRQAAEAVTRAAERVERWSAVVAGLPTGWQPEPLDPPLAPSTLRDVAGRVEHMLTELAAIQEQRDGARERQTAAAAEVDHTERDHAELVVHAVQRAVSSIEHRSSRVHDLVLAVRHGLTLDEPDPDAVAAADPASDPGAALADPPAVTVPAGVLDAPTVRATIDAATAAQTHTHATVDAGGQLVDRLRARAESARARLSDRLTATGFATLAELQAAAGGAQELARHADHLVVVAEAAVADAAALDAYLDVARPFLANLSVLVAALRDNAFLGRLVAERETALIAEASRRLQDITKGRFGFVTDFGIVSIGSGEVRTPDTLSGGERFQAALALALSLVEIASRGGGRLEAVFVDEGFGSLDAHALDMALNTLGTVAGGGKMVALISHLRPVAEYVGTVLEVTKDDVLGSRITQLDGDALDILLTDDIRSGLTT